MNHASRCIVANLLQSRRIQRIHKTARAMRNSCCPTIAGICRRFNLRQFRFCKLHLLIIRSRANPRDDRHPDVLRNVQHIAEIIAIVIRKQEVTLLCRSVFDADFTRCFRSFHCIQQSLGRAIVSARRKIFKHVITRRIAMCKHPKLRIVLFVGSLLHNHSFTIFESQIAMRNRQAVTAFFDKRVVDRIDAIRMLDFLD